jgi:hypothetical protein
VALRAGSEGERIEVVSMSTWPENFFTTSIAVPSTDALRLLVLRLCSHMKALRYSVLRFRFEAAHVEAGERHAHELRFSDSLFAIAKALACTGVIMVYRSIAKGIMKFGLFGNKTRSRANSSDTASQAGSRTSGRQDAGPSRRSGRGQDDGPLAELGRAPTSNARDTRRSGARTRIGAAHDAGAASAMSPHDLELAAYLAARIINGETVREREIPRLIAANATLDEARASLPYGRANVREDMANNNRESRWRAEAGRTRSHQLDGERGTQRDDWRFTRHRRRSPSERATVANTAQSRPLCTRSASNRTKKFT